MWPIGGWRRESLGSYSLTHSCQELYIEWRQWRSKQAWVTPACLSQMSLLSHFHSSSALCLAPFKYEVSDEFIVGGLGNGWKILNTEVTYSSTAVTEIWLPAAQASVLCFWSWQSAASCPWRTDHLLKQTGRGRYNSTICLYENGSGYWAELSQRSMGTFAKTSCRLLLRKMQLFYYQFLGG